MKLMIAGSRSITNIDLSQYVSNDIDLIISGGASGIDTLAEAYADKKRISKLILRPSYQRYGRGAPIIRNAQMVDIADEVLVIWDGSSKGTKNTIEYAQSKNKPVKLVIVKKADLI